MRKIGATELNKLLPDLDSSTFSNEIFSQTGLFVIRNAIPAAQLSTWTAAWKTVYESDVAGANKVNRFNPVSIDQEMPPVLADVHKSSALLDIIEQAFGPDLALYNQRFVIKDKDRQGNIFLHSDFPYHYGWPNKASAVVALSNINQDNGGMFFYPGTQQFGYLSDAGEINPEVLPKDWPVISPALNAGDVVLMHSATWHGSHPFVSGPDRIFVDIIYQPADDPSGVALLRGDWQTEIFINKEMKSRLYKRSRSSRLIELQKQVDAMETSVNTQ